MITSTDPQVNLRTEEIPYFASLDVKSRPFVTFLGEQVDQQAITAAQVQEALGHALALPQQQQVGHDAKVLVNVL